MYQVTADVLNVFHVPATEKYDETFKVQLIGDNHMKNGQVKKELLTLSVPEKTFLDLKGEIGNPVTLPVSFFAQGSQITAFYPKNNLSS